MTSIKKKEIYVTKKINELKDEFKTIINFKSYLEYAKSEELTELKELNEIINNLPIDCDLFEHSEIRTYINVLDNFFENSHEKNFEEEISKKEVKINESLKKLYKELYKEQDSQKIDVDLVEETKYSDLYYLYLPFLKHFKIDFAERRKIRRQVQGRFGIPDLSGLFGASFEDEEDVKISILEEKTSYKHRQIDNEK